MLATVFSFGTAVSVPEGNRSLKIYHIHTGEKQEIVFKRDGVYDKNGLRQLNYILRDWRKNRPTNMDPHLFDLLWQVYGASGSGEYIHVVCGFRSPETNAMLRHRSRGVAKHSQHMLGKAMDFFIPGVPLAKLREIGLRMQVGGVGYYPTSGSPFVHMDTGNVRMWPKMSRTQLARVFPNGKTLYVPSDGKPLPGYGEALAAYKARKGTPAIMVASRDDEDDTSDDAVVLTRKASGGIAVAKYDDAVPTPRPSPARPSALADAGGQATGRFASPQNVQAFFQTAFADSDDLVTQEQQEQNAALQEKIATLQPAPPVARRLPPVALRQPVTQRVALAAAPMPLRDVDFDSADAAPSVPVQLAAAMAERDQAGRLTSASLPIAPTAVVATIDVTRPLRAEAMTTAVLRKTGDVEQPIPPVLAYAAPMDEVAPKPHTARMTAGIPLPQTNPVRHPVAQPAPVAAEPADDIYGRLPTVELTMTKLDTQGLRLWSASVSTREKRYALLTMPDFSQVPSLLDKPVVSYAAGFGASPYEGLRTDSFSGALVQPLAIVDLTASASVATR